MSLTDLIQYVKNAGSKDIFDVLTDLSSTLSRWAETSKIYAWIPFVILILIAVGVGFFGYKLIKLIMPLGLGYVGYFVGIEIFRLCHQCYDWMPTWIAYIVGVVVAIGFMILAYVKFSYAIFSFSAVLGYYVLLFYTGNAVVAIGGGIVYAMLSICLIRTVFILSSSFICGMLTVGCLSQLLPAVKFLQFENGKLGALIVGLVLTVIYAVVQFIINRNAGEGIEE